MLGKGGSEGGHVRVNYAIVLVSDMGRSVAFYRDVLGLPLRFESPGWTEFATEGATLVLHPAEGGAGTGGPDAEHAGACRPGLRVEDLGAFHERVTARGVRCVEAPREVFGARVALYADPDGLVFAVGEGRKGG